MDLKNFKVENAKAIVIVIVVVAILGFGLYYINKTFGGIGDFVNSITSAVGITDTPEEAAKKAAVDQAQAQSSSVTSCWNPSFFQNAPGGASLFTQAQGDALAAQIWGFKGFFINDDSEVLSAIKQCNTQSQVSFVSWRFSVNYSNDLFTWLTLQMTNIFTGRANDVLTDCISYVNSLPQYN